VSQTVGQGCKVDLLRPHLTVFYDDGGSIGRRYARQDEAGTPYCITVDGQTLQDSTVTLRDRDSMEQERVSTDKLLAHLAEKPEQMDLLGIVRPPAHEDGANDPGDEDEQGDTEGADGQGPENLPTAGAENEAATAGE
jgi:hypothetical protein